MRRSVTSLASGLELAAGLAIAVALGGCCADEPVFRKGHVGRVLTAEGWGTSYEYMGREYVSHGRR